MKVYSKNYEENWFKGLALKKAAVYLNKKEKKIKEQFEVMKNIIIYLQVKFKRFLNRIKTYSNKTMFAILQELNP